MKSFILSAVTCAILYSPVTAHAGGLGEAFSNAAKRLTTSQSSMVFKLKKPAANAQPPLVQRLDNGNAQIKWFSAPQNNGTGKWYQKEVKPDATNAAGSFKKWSP